MVKKAKLMKMLLLIVEFTSIPLIALGFIYLVSGYQMLSPELKIIPEPRRIHTDMFLRILSISLAYLHALGGVMIIIERRLRRDILKKIAEIFAITVLTALLLASLIIETITSDIGRQYQLGA
ncbi:MAG: hypothetical protein QXX99_03635 [Candidatus Bathyarchaeia archaeon]